MYYTFTYHGCAYYDTVSDFTATRVDGIYGHCFGMDK